MSRPIPRSHPARVVPGPAGAFLVAALAGAGALAVGAPLVPGASAAGLVAALVAYGIAAGTALFFLRRDYPHPRLGACNLVTLARLVLVAALLPALVAGSGPSWPVFAVALVALALDGVDGYAARRQGLASSFGARFDMEVDSAFALVLAVAAATGPLVGWPALLLGLPRYLFGLAGLALPWLDGPLPPRFSRKAVCVLQLGTLIALQAPVTPAWLAAALLALAAAALAWSFGRDIAVLWRARR